MKAWTLFGVCWAAPGAAQPPGQDVQHGDAPGKNPWWFFLQTNQQLPWEVFSVWERRGRAGDGEMSPVLLEDSPVNPIVLERAPCTLGSFGLCWGEMEEVGRARVARQHSPYSGKINPRIMERRDPFLACCLFLSSSVVRLARIPAAAPGSNVTFSCSKGPRGLSLVMKTGIFGSAGAEGWWRQARLVLRGKGIVGKANSLSLDTSHSCTTCFWQTFVCLLFPCLQGSVLWSLLRTGLRLVLGFAWIEVAPSAPGD